MLISTKSQWENLVGELIIFKRNLEPGEPNVDMGFYLELVKTQQQLEFYLELGRNMAQMRNFVITWNKELGLYSEKATHMDLDKNPHVELELNL